MVSFNKIPILDCSKIAGKFADVRGSEALKEFAKELGDGMKSAGVVYLINHDTPNSTTMNMQEKVKEFLCLPKEVKAKYRKADPVENFFGFSPAKERHPADIENANAKPESGLNFLRESLDCWGTEAYKDCNYPTEISGLKDSVDSYRSSQGELAMKLFYSFAIYLGLEDEEYFVKRHMAIDDKSVDTCSLVKSTLYHPVNQKDCNPKIADGALWLGAHCDIGTITLLSQDDVGGLEAKLADGEWVNVAPIKDSFVLQAGQMLELWSGGHLPATPHRVKFIASHGDTQRQSAIYIITPDSGVRVNPVVRSKDGWNQQHSEGQTYGEFFKAQLRIVYSTDSFAY